MFISVLLTIAAFILYLYQFFAKKGRFGRILYWHIARFCVITILIACAIIYNISTGLCAKMPDTFTTSLHFVFGWGFLMCFVFLGVTGIMTWRNALHKSVHGLISSIVFVLWILTFSIPWLF